MPKRILILSIILIVFSGIGLASNLFSFFTGSLPAAKSSVPAEMTMAMNIIGGVVTIFCGIGFLKRMNKVRIFYTVYMSITSIVGVFSIYTMELPAEAANMVPESTFKVMSILFMLTMVAIPLIILYTKKSNEYFALTTIQERNNEIARGEEEQKEE